VEFDTAGGPVQVLDGVSLDVRPGEVVGVVGESGSGKTVTALSIMRLLTSPPARIVGGEVWFEGADLLSCSLEEMRRVRGARLAMVFQDPMTSLNPAFTVGNQLVEAIRLHEAVARAEARRRSVDLLHLVGMPDPRERLDDYPHQLSGGMRQRVMLAIALACEPRLLIADEPTTSLDVTIQAQYLELLKEVQRSTGVAVILVTHDFGIVAANADRVAVMYAGRIVEMGSTLQVFDNPRHPYTQALLRCLPDVELGRQRLIEIGGQPPDLAQLPPGCPFAPRCPRRQPICEEAYPPAVALESGHVAHCWVAAADGA
jgi:oligopeptide/dipeptide ABC transporter ATP-binding protein